MNDRSVRYQVTLLPDQRSHNVSADETLLSALIAAGEPLRHACRNGVCEICEAQLLSGEVEQRYPPAHLTGGEGFENAPLIRLCTSYPQSDLQLKLQPYALKAVNKKRPNA